MDGPFGPNTFHLKHNGMKDIRVDLVTYATCAGIVLSYTNTIHILHVYIYIYILWIYKCVIRRVGCETSHKYTNIQIQSVKHYKHFTKTIL